MVEASTHQLPRTSQKVDAKMHNKSQTDLANLIDSFCVNVNEWVSTPRPPKPPDAIDSGIIENRHRLQEKLQHLKNSAIKNGRSLTSKLKDKGQDVTDLQKMLGFIERSLLTNAHGLWPSVEKCLKSFRTGPYTPMQTKTAKPRPKRKKSRQRTSKIIPNKFMDAAYTLWKKKHTYREIASLLTTGTYNDGKLVQVKVSKTTVHKWVQYCIEYHKSHRSVKTQALPTGKRGEAAI